MSVGGSSASARSRSVESSISAEASLPSKRVALLLESIPVELQARAAFQCGAHARALLYFETHVRAKESGALNPAALRSASYCDEDVSFFQVTDRMRSCSVPVGGVSHPCAALCASLQWFSPTEAGIAWLCLHAGSVREAGRAGWAVRAGAPSQRRPTIGRPGE